MNIVAMTIEHNFSFKELIIDRIEMTAILGFGSGELPEPFPEYMDEVFRIASTLNDIRTGYILVDDFEIVDNKQIVIDNLVFNAGRLICNELKGSQKLALFVCTAGEKISKISKELMAGENPVLGYVYDLMGSFIAEAAGDRMQQFIKEEASKENMFISNRYSPGYCDWSVQDQHKLFSFFNGNSVGVTLTDSALMHPVKSISGVIGIGEDVEFREYRCAICTSKTCTLRKLRR
jgi:hypothetical protein